MNRSAHDCPDCDGSLLVDDSDHPELEFECESCGSTFYGRYENNEQIVVGPAGI